MPGGSDRGMLSRYFIYLRSPEHPSIAPYHPKIGSSISTVGISSCRYRDQGDPAERTRFRIPKNVALMLLDAGSAPDHPYSGKTHANRPACDSGQHDCYETTGSPNNKDLDQVPYRTPVRYPLGTLIRPSWNRRTQCSSFIIFSNQGCLSVVCN